VLADVGRADGVADRAAGAVAADDVLRLDGAPAAGPVDGDADAPGVLLETGHRVPGDEGARGDLPDGPAQHLLQHVLRRLLAQLGEPVAVRDEAEDPGEPRQLAPAQRRAEHGVLGERDGQRGGRAEPVGQAPAAQVLHRADVDRLGPRARPGDLGPRLDEGARDPAQPQFDRGGQAHRARAGDEHGRRTGQRVPGVGGAHGGSVGARGAGTVL
jgi:hypothetical protein